MLTLELFFAGLKEILLHVGVATIMAALCVALAYISKRPACLWLAFVIVIFLFGELVGIHDEKLRVNAQQQVVEQSVNAAVAKTLTPRYKKSSDPWDKRSN